MDSRKQALYVLALARNVRAQHHDLLVSQLGSLEALLDTPTEELRQLNLVASILHRIIEVRDGVDPAEALGKLAEQGISMLGWQEEGYPELLAALPDAPLALFVKGNTSLLKHHGIAIVGSRKCTRHGLEHARRFGADLAELGIPVVSGMALGIDGSAHEGALFVEGPTVAVLGCGVDVVYPSRHHELYERLCEHGAVVSEYPMGTAPDKAHFPQRNRIISGMSKGVLVVEAPAKSGALITARLAIEQEREVFALPGPITSPYTKGCHLLIKQGVAKLVENVDDILVEFGTNRAVLHKERFGAAGQPEKKDIESGQPAAASEAKPGLAISPEEEKVLAALSYEGTHVNDVVRKLGISTSDCIAHLTMLEIKGLISTAGGGFYLRL